MELDSFIEAFLLLWHLSQQRQVTLQSASGNYDEISHKMKQLTMEGISAKLIVLRIPEAVAQKNSTDMSNSGISAWRPERNRFGRLESP